MQLETSPLQLAYSTKIIGLGGLSIILYFLRDDFRVIDALHLQKVAFLTTNGIPCKRGKYNDSSTLTCHGYLWMCRKNWLTSIFLTF
jgi:hypothetical protein